ncbi:hypothetical protein NKR23_g12398 [Pleurostoma richardsiae]|uniref:Uncharacterized protein n=1 Tax=Pleurostoma richardsiae TaxID=41990 RepID=A0AA38R260_9PEZI|nr:hypothetical protein NKR23_g12398 [Pleurostoma richardsiae]
MFKNRNGEDASVVRFSTIRACPAPIQQWDGIRQAFRMVKALRPWISQWFGRIRGGSSTDDLALLLVAAYFFRASEHFKSVSARVVRQANANLSSIWASHDMMAFLPQELKGVRARDSANHGYGTTLTD